MPTPAQGLTKEGLKRVQKNSDFQKNSAIVGYLIEITKEANKGWHYSKLYGRKKDTRRYGTIIDRASRALKIISQVQSQ